MIHKGVFAIPCDHPAAQDGFFYCLPSYFDSENLRGHVEFVLVDTKKVVTSLRENNPKFLGHAAHKMSGTSAEEWLATNSPENPVDMGYWSYDPKLGFRMAGGQPAHLQLVQDIHLPCFPVAVEKTSPALLSEMRAKVACNDEDILDYFISGSERSAPPRQVRPIRARPS